MSRAILLLTLASFGGVAILQFVAVTTQPPLVAFEDLPLHAGTTVRVEGRILDVHEYDGGFVRGLLSGSNRSVPFLADDGVEASPGDVVALEARVLQENGRIELEVEHRGDLEILRPWRDAHVPLDRILDEPWSYRQSNLRTSGWVEEDARYVWLRGDRDARVRLAGLRDAFFEDERVVVDGLFAYEPENGGFRLHVERVTVAGD